MWPISSWWQRTAAVALSIHSCPLSPASGSLYATAAAAALALLLLVASADALGPPLSAVPVGYVLAVFVCARTGSAWLLGAFTAACFVLTIAPRGGIG